MNTVNGDVDGGSAGCDDNDDSADDCDETDILVDSDERDWIGLERHSQNWETFLAVVFRGSQRLEGNDDGSSPYWSLDQLP